MEGNNSVRSEDNTPTEFLKAYISEDESSNTDLRSERWSRRDSTTSRASVESRRSKSLSRRDSTTSRASMTSNRSKSLSRRDSTTSRTSLSSRFSSVEKWAGKVFGTSNKHGDYIKQLKLENEDLKKRLADLNNKLHQEKTKRETVFKGLKDEIVENLRDIQQNLDVRDKTSLKLDYTLSLTDSSLMEKSIQELKKIKASTSRYYFKDIDRNAKFGVMRILRKYCVKDPKVTVNEFADKLGVNDVYLKHDRELDEDTCTDILVKWVQASSDNTADVLEGLYPRLRRFGSVRGNIGSQSVYGSISMLDVSGPPGKSEFLNELKDWISDHTGNTNDLLLDRIKTALKETFLTAALKHSV